MRNNVARALQIRLFQPCVSCVILTNGKEGSGGIADREKEMAHDTDDGIDGTDGRHVIDAASGRHCRIDVTSGRTDDAIMLSL